MLETANNFTANARYSQTRKLCDCTMQHQITICTEHLTNSNVSNEMEQHIAFPSNLVTSSYTIVACPMHSLFNLI